MTLSKEKFEHILAYAKQQQKLGMHHCKILPDDMVAIMEMAAGRLERRERDKQEPVGIVRYVGLGHRKGIHVSLYERLPEGIELYAGPPEPVLPDELLTAMEEVLRISDRHHDAWDRAKAALSSCRAATLNQTHVKQPESNGGQQ